MDGGEEDDVEFVATSVDPVEALEAAEEAFDLVATAVDRTVVVVRFAAVGAGRDDWLVAEFERDASSRVVLVGAVHDEIGLIAGRTETAEQFAATGRVVALTR